MGMKTYHSPAFPSPPAESIEHRVVGVIIELRKRSRPPRAASRRICIQPPVSIYPTKLSNRGHMPKRQNERWDSGEPPLTCPLPYANLGHRKSINGSEVLPLVAKSEGSHCPSHGTFV